MIERHVAYYGLTNDLDKLYNNALNDSYKFGNLRKLVISDKNIRLAIKLISENPGRNTPGIDEMTFSDLMNYTDESVISEVRSILLLHKKPELVKRVYIPKENGKLRPLGIATILNRIAQQAILNTLLPITEARFSKNSFAFRSNLSVKHAFAKFAHGLYTTKNQKWIIDIDFESYFDNVDLELCLEKLTKYFGIKENNYIEMIRTLMSSDTLDETEVISYLGIGLAQGSILGPVLSNVMLHDLDQKFDLLNAEYRASNLSKNISYFLKNDSWQRIRKGKGVISVNYKRYADDIRIITSTEEEAKELLNIVKIWSEENSVKLSLEKTSITNTSENALFVGFSINKKENGSIFSPKNPDKIKRELKKAFRSFTLKKSEPSEFIALLTAYLYQYSFCSNMSWLCDYSNSLAYNFYYRRRNPSLIEFNKSADGNNSFKLYFRNKSNYLILDPFKLRSLTSDSIQDYMKNIPYFSGYKNPTERLDCSEYIQYQSELEYPARCLMYLPGLLHKQKFNDPITGRFLYPNSCHIHHIKPQQRGGKDEFKNLLVVDWHIHRQLHSSLDKCQKELKENKKFLKYWSIIHE